MNKEVSKIQNNKKNNPGFCLFLSSYYFEREVRVKKKIYGGGDKRKQNTKWGWRLRRYTHRYDNNYSLWERGRKREIKGNELTGSVMC